MRVWDLAYKHVSVFMHFNLPIKKRCILSHPFILFLIEEHDVTDNRIIKKLTKWQ